MMLERDQMRTIIAQQGDSISTSFFNMVSTDSPVGTTGEGFGSWIGLRYLFLKLKIRDEVRLL